MESRPNRRNGKNKTSFNDLPSEMAVYILSRLPVKSLIRSTSVSKTWSSLILNPNFISSQIAHSLSSCNNNAVLIIPTSLSHQNYCNLVSAETGFVLDKYEIPFTTRTGSLDLVGSVNGLVCVIELPSSNVLYLWNPCLRKYRLIDSSCFSNDVFGDWGKPFYLVGFGFHQPSCDYRVIRIVSCRGDKGGLVENVNVVPRVEVFSLKMNEWREIENPFGLRLAMFRSRITVNSIMYMLSTSRPVTYSEEVWIVMFDFNNEVFEEMKIPDDVRYCLGETAYFYLMKFEGSLCVCVFDKSVSGDIETEPCCVWLMRNEGGIISWTKRFSVVHKEVGFPIHITKSGALIMLSFDLNSHAICIMSCHLKSLQYKYLGFDNSFDRELLPATVDTSFIESLVMHAGGDRLLKSAN